MKHKLLLKSLTIRERLSLIDKIKKVDSTNYQSLLNLWVKNNGESSSNYFKRRIENSNINEDTIPYLLSDIQDFNFKKFIFPKWYTEFNKFIKKTRKLEYSLNTEIPFFEISQELAGYFLQNFEFDKRFFNNKFKENFSNEIIKDFSEVLSQSALEYFYKKNLSYQEFIEEFCFKEFFNEYPYLTRIIFTKGNFIIKNFKVIFNSVSKDFNKIQKTFNFKENTRFDNIKFSGSDTHNFGKSVIILETDSENKLIFKFRSGSIDKKFNKIYQKITKDNKFDFQIPNLNIISTKNYSWVEFYNNIPCLNEREVAEYYEKIGIILFLFYILETTDIHNENLISSNNNPHLVDLETLFSGETLLNRPFINKLSEELEFTYGFSILRAGLLPNFTEDSEGNVRNISALSDGSFDNNYIKVKWSNIGTDSIFFEYSYEIDSRNKNLVYLNDKIIDPFSYSSIIKTTFKNLYINYLSNKEELKALFKEFKNEKFRFIFRPTRVYASLLLYLYHPDFMKDGILRSLELEKLASPIVEDLDKKYVFWDIFEDELKQLENLDIPYFYSFINSYNIKSEYGLDILGYKNTALNRINFKINNLSLADLNLQLDLIENSFNKIELDPPVSFNPRDFIDYTDEEIYLILERIFHKLKDSSVNIDGRVTWVGNKTNTSGTNIQFSPIGNDIANGNMGVACFLSAYYKLTNNPEVLTFLEKVLLPIEDIINHKWSLNQYSRVIGVGGTVGLGSLVYGLIKVYEFTNDVKYLKLAQKCLDDLEFDITKFDFKFDITSGVSGFILSLIKLYEYNKSSTTLDLIKNLSDKLTNLGFENSNFINWNYKLEKKILGFSHGSSGGFYALTKVNKLLSNLDSFKINSVLNYEQSFYRPEYNNWPDFRDVEENYNTVSWCHGGVGIGFSRAQLIRDNYENELISKNIEDIITKMISKNFEYTDTVCCGLGGWVDFLIELSNCNYPDIRIEELRRDVIKKLLFNFREKDNFYYGKKLNPRIINAGFYQGISGIGYELIRELKPRDFKSILLFE